RYYDSSTGRFLTKDPAQDGRNWYAYCGSQPGIKVDPEGTDGWWKNLWDKIPKPSPQAIAGGVIIWTIWELAGHAHGNHEPWHGRPPQPPIFGPTHGHTGGVGNIQPIKDTQW